MLRWTATDGRKWVPPGPWFDGLTTSGRDPARPVLPRKGRKARGDISVNYHGDARRGRNTSLPELIAPGLESPKNGVDHLGWLIGNIGTLVETMPGKCDRARPWVGPEPIWGPRLLHKPEVI